MLSRKCCCDGGCRHPVIVVVDENQNSNHRVTSMPSQPMHFLRLVVVVAAVMTLCAVRVSI